MSFILKLRPKVLTKGFHMATGFIEKVQNDQLSSLKFLPDNWNVWDEGHYLLPYTYMVPDIPMLSVVFSDSADKHIDLIPENIGMGS